MSAVAAHAYILGRLWPMTMPAVSTAPLPVGDPPTLDALSTSPGGAALGRALPGPLVWRLVAVAVLALALGAGGVGWWMARAATQQTMLRLQERQNDEVEGFARLLSSKVEQSQKMLRSVADNITPDMLDLPASLEWQLQQGLAAAQFFDTLMVARSDGLARVQLQQGRFVRSPVLDAQWRSVLERTLAEGKPQVAEWLTGGEDGARIVLTMPLLREGGSLLGVVAGTLRLQSQGLLPASLALPQRPETRLLVFARDGTILAHSNPVRVLGQVRDEPGLADALAPSGSPWADGLAGGLAEGLSSGGGTTRMLPHAMVSLAAMPLTQWTVARVSDTAFLLSPVQGVLRSAWGQALAGLAMLALLMAAWLLWLAHPLARLRQQARHLLQAQAALPRWPRQRGEMADLAAVFEGLVAAQAQQARQGQTLRAQWQALLAQVPAAVAVTRGGQIEAVGRHMALMLGYTPQELQGRDVPLLYTPLLRSSLSALEGPLCDGPAQVEQTLCLRRKDGSAVWVQAQGRPVREGEPALGMFWSMQELTAQRYDRNAVHWADTHDVLTGLDNRPGLELRLRAWAESALQPDAAGPGAGEPATAVLLFLDLDHFTFVNDGMGHAAGDAVLCDVARLLQRMVRGAGWVARLGGDEFAVLLPACSEAHAGTVAEQLRHAVQALEPTVQGRTWTLGMSVGMVVLAPGDLDVGAALHAADMACYDAKRAGRNCVRSRSVGRSTALT